jgi:competence ComEA-like helix-hairpin-helix protein
MRRRTQVPLGADVNWRTWFFAAGAVIVLLSASIWLLRSVEPRTPDSARRDVVQLVPQNKPREGSLVVNINTATQAELETVPGIGPARAALIIAGRPYESTDALLRVSGIGAQTLESIRPFVKTEGDTQPRPD